jgi:hypothetical protein
MDTSARLAEGSAFTAHDVLPQLPGYRSNRTAASYKTSTMKYHEGQRFMSNNPVSSRLMIADSNATGLTLGTGKPNHSMGLPKKVFSLSKKPVLCFQAYFKEAVHESRLENYRVHKCDIFYYTDDDSIEITERKFENSGMPQGNFMKRHQVPKDEDSFYTLADIVVGNTIVFYGRTFQIIDANEETQAYLKNQFGRDDGSLGSPGGKTPNFPEDKYESSRSLNTWDPNIRYNVKKNPTSVFAEAALGKTVDNSGRAGFLKYDRMVLRFACIWDDRESLYGDVQQFKLHYFVSDNTMEVLSVYGQNSGRDPAPLLVKRSKVPKDLKDESKGTYHWSDLDIGNVIELFTRPLLLVDADESTREFFKKQGKPLSQAQVFAEEEPSPLIRKIPPTTGFGSEEDSLTSCVGSLVQNPPKKTLGDNRTLRFLGRFITEKPEDADREFVISYYISDKTVAVHEPPKRNSGIVGGPFLSRLPAKQLSEGDTVLSHTSFFVGATVAICGHLFAITDTDSGTLDYMEEHCESFPHSDFLLIVEKVAKSVADATENGSFVKVCDDASDDGVSLSAEAFKQVMEYFDCATPEQQCITLFRGLNSGGSVSIERLLEELRG